MSNIRDQQQRQWLEEEFWARPVGAGVRRQQRWLFQLVLMGILVLMAGLLSLWLYQRQPPRQTLVVKPYTQAIKQVPVESTADEVTHDFSVLGLHNPMAGANAQASESGAPPVVLPPVIDGTRVPGLEASEGLAEKLLDQQQATWAESGAVTESEAVIAAILAGETGHSSPESESGATPVVSLVPVAPVELAPVLPVDKVGLPAQQLAPRLDVPGVSDRARAIAGEETVAEIIGTIVEDRPEPIDQAIRAETYQRLINKINDSRRQALLAEMSPELSPEFSPEFSPAAGGVKTLEDQATATIEPASDLSSTPLREAGRELQSDNTLPASSPAASDGGIDGGIRVQIASLLQHVDAVDTTHRLFRQHGDLLGNFQTSIRRVELVDKGVYHRVYVEGFTSLAQANDWCRQWQKVAGDCLVMREQ